MSRYNRILLYSLMLTTGGHARLLQYLFTAAVQDPFEDWIVWLNPGYVAVRFFVFFGIVQKSRVPVRRTKRTFRLVGCYLLFRTSRTYSERRRRPAQA